MASSSSIESKTTSSIETAINSDASFEYSPLKGSEIRIVALHPGTGSEKISCAVQNVNLSLSPTYRALSYTWGDPTTTHEILLNGQPFGVTENLHSAFINLRNPDQMIPFWIDAICINQYDIPERNSQVRRMKDIYEKADVVICWLGPDADDSALAMGKLLEITRAMKSHLSKGENIVDVVNTVVETQIQSILGRTQLELEQVFAALECLFYRPWWYRIWVVQEATTSVETMIVCAGTWITRDAAFFSILAIMKFLDIPENAEFISRSCFVNAMRLNMFRDDRLEGGSKMELLSLLQAFRRYEATDLRDKVYAILPLAVDSSELLPDYARTVSSVYTSVVSHFLGQKGDLGERLDVLGLCGERTEGDDELPSWVPDFRVYTPEQPFVKRLPPPIDNPDSKTQAYSASGSCSDDIIPLMSDQFPIAILDNLLRIHSAKVDVIAHVTSVSTEKVVYGIEKSWAPTNGSARYFTGETMSEAFLRTIVADMKWERGKPVSRNYSMIWPGQDTKLLTDLNDHHVSLKTACLGRRLGITKRGIIGLVPQDTRLGDEIHVLAGGQVLYILRPPLITTSDIISGQEKQSEKEKHDLSEDPGASDDLLHIQRLQTFMLESDTPKEKCHRFVGECYMHGLMDGAMLDMIKSVGGQFSGIYIR